MAESTPMTAYQPFKTLYMVGGAFYGLCVRLPLIALYFSWAGNRQDPTWTWKQAIAVSMMKFMFRVITKARFTNFFPIDRSGKNPNEAVIPAVPNEKLKGVLRDPDVKPADIMSEWYPAPFEPEDVKRGTKIILHMFGGAYVTGRYYPNDYVFTNEKLCPAINGKILVVGYRLAPTAGGCPFPAQLQDLFCAYHYLLGIGVSSDSILLSGESAGGNTVTTFLRLLEEPEQKLPLPRAALLSSPWIDMTTEASLRRKDPRYDTDIVEVELLAWGQRTFIPKNRTGSDPWISPIVKPFRSRVPIWMEAGMAEVAFDLASQFVKAMQGAGTDVHFFTVPHATHVPLWSAGMVGFDTSGSVDSVAAFLKERGL